MTDKHVFTLSIQPDCADPVAYVRGAIESFQSVNGKIEGDISVKINTENAELCDIVRNAIPDINIIDGYPKPGEPLHPETYQLPNYIPSALRIELPADCENPEDAIRRAIELYRETYPSVATLIELEKEQWVKRIMGLTPFEGTEGEAVVIDYPVEALLSMDPTSARGRFKHSVILDDSPYINTGKENVADLSKAPRIDLNDERVHLDVKISEADLTNGVTYDGVKEYTPLIRQWAEDRNIIGGGSTTLDQFIKGLTEAGELWTHVGKGQHALLKDDIGDVYVCLVNAAGNLDIKLEEHVKALTPVHLHGGRAAYQAKGLKRYSLQVLHTMANVAAAIENVLDADNDKDVEFFKLDFCEACADVVYVLETIALEHEWSLTECIVEAYNDIRDRKGLMVNGCFIKEKDFTIEMVEAALADEATKPGTREYLTQWMLGQVAKTAEKIGDTVEAKVAATRKPFWRVWNEAQGNLANVAPFDLTNEAIALLNKSQGEQFLTTLGVFGQPNHNGEVFVIDPVKLNVALENMVGKPVGELDNPEFEKDQTLESRIQRLTTVEQANSAGVLVDYVINHLGAGEHGPIIEVIGLIEPSAATKDRVATAGNVYFGIRSLVEKRLTTSDNVRVNKVTTLVCFDLSIENPRELK